MNVTTFWAVLDHVECGARGCGIVFGISPSLHTAMKERGRHVYCPNGHHITYSDNELDRVQKRLAQQIHLADQVSADRDAWRRRAHHEERRAVALKGHHTRLKNRVVAGVCPCCTRSFVNLRRHIATKHPAYQKADV